MTILLQVVHGVDVLAMSLAIGATAWFFFIQSPILHKAMKREQFVPIQMRLTKVLFSTLLVLLVIRVIVEMSRHRAGSSSGSWSAGGFGGGFGGGSSGGGGASGSW